MSKLLLDYVFPIRNRQAPAVVYHDGDCSITLLYGDLSDDVHQISKVLNPICYENCVVVFAIQKLHHLVPSLILGVLKSKASFMYLDPDFHPLSKQEVIVKRSNTSVIISDSTEAFSGWELTTTVTVSGVNQLHIFQKCLPSRIENFPLPEEWNIAYLIHTSGSTGTPKVVRVPHACLLPNILDLRKICNIQQTDVIFIASPFTFDPSIVDLFLAFSTGAKMVIVKPSIKAMPSKLAEIIRDEGVTFLQATPSFFLQFGPQLSKNYLLYPSSPLRIILLGGEAFPALKTLSEFSSPGNSTIFYNIYGITEVSCWATLSKIDFNENQVDLGHALSETDLRVLNEEDEEIYRDQGGEGYLWLGGRRICLLDDETPDSIKKPVFRPTGDRVEFLNGKLYYRGRKDETVKRMGKRLNLNSIEILALSSGLVRQCCALLDSNQLLVLVCSGISVVDDLLQFFQNNAAAVEQPDFIRILDSLPLSKHGKIDRKKLLRVIQTIPKLEETFNWEIILAKEWRNATGQTASDESNFILSGGNSLSALRVVSRIQEALVRPFPLLIDILLNQNWKKTVDYIRKESDGLKTPIKNNSKVKIFQRNRTFEKLKSSLDFDLTSIASTLELKQIWKFNSKKCIDASPLVIQRKKCDVVFIGSHSHRFSAIRMDNGQEIWTTTLPGRIESSACCDINGLNIFVGCYDGNLYCLDASSGRICWHYSTGDAIKSSPVCTGPSVIFGSHDHTLYSLSVVNGELLWKRTISDSSLFASVAWDSNNRILSAALDGTCSALDVTSGQLLWTVKLSTPIFSSPVWCSNSERCLLASVDGFLNCCSTETGCIVWRFKAAGPIFSTPIVADKRIIFGSHDHFLYCLDVESGLQLWRVEFTNTIYSTPFVSSVIVICSDTSGYLKILDLATGRLLAQTRLDGEVFSSPVMVDQMVVVGCRDDNLYCFQLNNSCM